LWKKVFKQKNSGIEGNANEKMEIKLQKLHAKKKKNVEK